MNDLNLNNLKKLSVIIPAYNVEKFLVKCVESVLNQTYKNIEIIIVDDGSRDSTPQLCDELANKYNNIKVIHQANQGSGKTRENGLNASSGEYITFIDSDDYIDLNAYAKVIKVLEENNCDMVQFGIYNVGSNGEIISKWQRENMTLNSPRDIYLYFLTSEVAAWPIVDKVYRRSLFENIEWLKISMMEDYSISAQLFARAQKFMVIDEYFYYYVKNPVSICRSENNINLKLKSRNDELIASELVVRLTQQKIPELLPEALWRRILILEFAFMTYAAAREDEVSERDKNLNALTHEIRSHYAKFQAELQRQQGSLSARLKLAEFKPAGRSIYLYKYRAKTWVFVNWPKAAVLYSKLRLKIKDLFKI